MTPAERREASAAFVFLAPGLLTFTAFVLLPVVAWAVLLIWRNNPARPDPGAGGLLVDRAPMVALIVGGVLAAGFWAGQAAARRRLADGRG